MRAQDVLAAGGPQAHHIEVLWWVVLAVCALVFLAVLGALAWALLRARRAGHYSPPDVVEAERFAPRIMLAVWGAVGVSTALLIALTLASFVTDRALAGLGPAALEIQVTGHRYWWEVRYEPGDAARSFVTANELHIPVGKAVRIKLNASDVIHSFWVPELSGKKDLIPGRDAWLTLQADKPGIYRGQCAEFCGLQHAKMALLVQADERYDAWAAAQRAPARAPQSAPQERGRDVFMSSRCDGCHTILGTPASGTRGPDLTHLASRATLAAASVPNTIGHLAGWVLDPRGIKPGVEMPPSALAPDDLQALLAYLGSLQ